jgi:hypothetical protein
MIHILLPVQYLAKRGGHQREPQTRLMVAVLQTVVDDYRGSAYRHAAGLALHRDPRAYAAARAYVASTDRTWPFSFENLCEAVGLDAGSLRAELAREEDGGRSPDAVRDHESPTP